MKGFVRTVGEFRQGSSRLYPTLQEVYFRADQIVKVVCFPDRDALMAWYPRAPVIQQREGPIFGVYDSASTMHIVHPGAVAHVRRMLRSDDSLAAAVRELVDELRDHPTLGRNVIAAARDFDTRKRDRDE